MAAYIAALSKQLVTAKQSLFSAIWSPSALHPLIISCRGTGSVTCYQKRKRPPQKRTSKVPEKKKAIAKGVQNIFNNHEVVAVLHYNDLTVKEWRDLRFDLSQKEARVKLIPTKISQRALDHSMYRNIVVLFRGPTALVYCQHSSAVSGVLAALASHSKVELLGAVVEKEMVTRKGLQELANLPPLPQLQSQLVGVISSVPSTVAGILQHPQRRLVTLLEQHCQDRTVS